MLTFEKLRSKIHDVFLPELGTVMPYLRALAFSCLTFWQRGDGFDKRSPN